MRLHAHAHVYWYISPPKNMFACVCVCERVCNCVYMCVCAHPTYSTASCLALPPRALSTTRPSPQAAHSAHHFWHSCLQHHTPPGTPPANTAHHLALPPPVLPTAYHTPCAHTPCAMPSVCPMAAVRWSPRWAVYAGLSGSEPSATQPASTSKAMGTLSTCACTCVW